MDKLMVLGGGYYDIGFVLDKVKDFGNGFGLAILLDNVKDLGCCYGLWFVLDVVQGLVIGYDLKQRPCKPILGAGTTNTLQKPMSRKQPRCNAGSEGSRYDSIALLEA